MPLQRGAYDYVLKTNMARLVPAVRRALSDAAIRRAASHSNSSCATSSPPRRIGSGSTTATEIHFLQRFGAHTLGYAPEEILGTNASQYVHPEDLAALDFRHAHARVQPAHGDQPAGALAPSQRQLSLARAQHARVAGRNAAR
jgi:hypothetical protein